MQVTAVDILKNITSALAIAFLLFMTNVLVDSFTKTIEISVGRATILNRPGYLIQVDNLTPSMADNVLISIARPIKVDATSIDGGVKLEAEQLTDVTRFILK